MAKNKIKVSIASSSYALVADDDDQVYVIEAAQRVDDVLKAILKENASHVNNEKAAVLVALQCMTNTLKETEKTELFNRSIVQLIHMIDRELAYY